MFRLLRTKTVGEQMMSKSKVGAVTLILVALSSPGFAWEHAGHMATAAIAFEELEKARPEVIDDIGTLLLKHPDIAPFWVAANEATGKERVRRMFIECARWPDDSKFTPRDMGSWHMARWASTTDGAPANVNEAAEARHGKPAGQALEALELHAAMLANPETSASERALALCWVLHIAGDIHQPLHASDLFSEDFPTGNAAGALSYVEDPLAPTTMALHVLWDRNTMRVPTLEIVDGYAQTFPKRHPRSSFPELEKKPFSAPGIFEEWARESHQIAVDWAWDIDTTPDPAKDQSAEELLAGIVNFMLNGVSPVDEAPEVPAEYWQKLQLTAEQRITLAGYRIADIIIAAADNIEAQTRFVGK
jgi:hypothetical protein